MTPPSIVWFRRDLRCSDHPALTNACRAGGGVLPCFIWAPDAEGNRPPGAASKWWLHHSLAALREELRRRGSDLLVRAAPAPGPALLALARETGAGAVYWNRVPEPEARRLEERTGALLQRAGVQPRASDAALLFSPDQRLNRQGHPFKVFTPFWRHAMLEFTPEPPCPAPRKISAPPSFPKSDPLEALALRPSPDWAAGLRDTWTPGERGARLRWERFLRTGVDRYDDGRDRPDLDLTSRLSPHLHFGEITARQIVESLDGRPAARGFLRQLGWREFGHHLLEHFPHTPHSPLRPEFERFPWAPDPALLRAWHRGRTGYPIVDAGMRQLWRTGWMHNRVRMIAASFLVKDLLQPWQAGADWFWDTLADADLANNTLGWQWTAGCGADAAPYFRVFNPVLQGMRFDPDGGYVRRWIPELAKLEGEWIHRPWEAPAAVLRAAGIAIGADYPQPIVDHAAARDRALQAYSLVQDVRSG